MVGMQMADGDERQIARLRVRLAEAQIRAAAHVDEHLAWPLTQSR